MKLWTGDDDGRRTDDGAWPSYKLTLLAFGSGELKMGYAGVNLFFLMFCRKHRLWVLVRTAPETIYVLRKVLEISIFPGEIFKFYMSKMSAYCMGKFSHRRSSEVITINH